MLIIPKKKFVLCLNDDIFRCEYFLFTLNYFKRNQNGLEIFIFDKLLIKVEGLPLVR